MPTPEHLGEQAVARLNANNEEILQLAEAGARSAWVQMQITEGWSEDYTTKLLTLVCAASAPYPADRPQGPGAFTAGQLTELRRLSWAVDDGDEIALRHFPLPDAVAGGESIRGAAALLALTLSRVYGEDHEPVWVEPPSDEERAALLAQIEASIVSDELS